MNADQPVNPLTTLGRLLDNRDGDVSPELRSQAARIIIKHRWSRTPPAARTEATAPARQAAWTRWLDLVDPERKFPSDITEKMAREARSAHMSALVLARHHGRKAGGVGPLHDAPGGDAA